MSYAMEQWYTERKVGHKSKCVPDRRVCWFGHVMSVDVDRFIQKYQSLKVDGSGGRGRPRKTWDEVLKAS